MHGEVMVLYGDGVSRGTLRGNGPDLDTCLDALARLVHDEYHATGTSRQVCWDLLRDIEDDLNLLVGERECERLFDVAYRTAERAALGDV